MVAQVLPPALKRKKREDDAVTTTGRVSSRSWAGRSRRSSGSIPRPSGKKEERVVEPRETFTERQNWRRRHLDKKGRRPR